MIRFSCWREKEVINICDGRCLGIICDLDIDECSGCIMAIIVPGPCKMFGLIKSDKDIVIPWCNIRKVGDDVILVDLPGHGHGREHGPGNDRDFRHERGPGNDREREHGPGREHGHGHD